MRRNRQISFDVLEGKALLSPGDPLIDSFGGLSEQEALALELILQQQQQQIIENDKALADQMLKESGAAGIQIHIFPAPPEIIMLPVPDDPTLYQQFMNALDAAIQAATESRTPLFPAIP